MSSLTQTMTSELAVGIGGGMGTASMSVGTIVERI